MTETIICEAEAALRVERRIARRIAQALSITVEQVDKTVELIDQGNTIPFIARYRKEATGALDDDTLRALEAKLTQLRGLEQTRQDVRRKIDEQGKLTPELSAAIEAAENLKALDDLYLPFRQKRRTRAGQARELGLEPLAQALLKGEITSASADEQLAPYLNDAVADADAALRGARDILAEAMAETPEIRELLRMNLRNSGMLHSELAKDADLALAATYEMYFDATEKLSDMPAHRVLAINRAEKEGLLKVRLSTTDERNLFRIMAKLTKAHPLHSDTLAYEQVRLAVEDGYKRLLLPSIAHEIRTEMKAHADAVSIGIFGRNLKPYLMQPPLKRTVVMGLDPGFRTGCKVAVVDGNGAFLDKATIYPTVPKRDVAGAVATMRRLIDAHGVKLIAIGNGTASRETEQVVADMIRSSGMSDLHYAIVNESGASIYSASELGAKEFPELDVTIRGAISIARRIQDPLAELVKIEPKHIGVGQYQHDVDQKALASALVGVVEGCVNAVGVNVNTASPSLLGYIAGISGTVAKNIVTYKEANGGFRSREELKKVKGLGPKAFTQCAGFLRIPDGCEPLDNTAVHPESYDIARKLAGRPLDELDFTAEAARLGVGELTLRDIVEELKRPGRDPREAMPEPILKTDVLSVDDLEEGLELTGTVRNVVAFGAFVDIGVHEDGLVHISQLGGGHYEDPAKVLQVADVVTVRVLSVDKKRGRIALTMRGVKQSEEIERRRRKVRSFKRPEGSTRKR